jgi:hypothetical protein
MRGAPAFRRLRRRRQENRIRLHLAGVKNARLNELLFELSGSTQAGLDSPIVRPMRSGNAVPGLYSTIALYALPLSFFPFAI